MGQHMKNKDIPEYYNIAAFANVRQSPTTQYINYKPRTIIS